MKITKKALNTVVNESLKRVKKLLNEDMTRLRPKDIHQKELRFHLLVPIIKPSGKPDMDRVEYVGTIVKLPGISRSQLRDPLSPEQPVIVRLDNGDEIQMIPGTDQKLTIADVTLNLKQ